MKTSKDIAAQFDITPGAQRALANGIDIIFSAGANMMHEKAIEAYKRNCRKYTTSCLDKYPDCSSDCEYLRDFITELNK